MEKAFMNLADSTITAGVVTSPTAGQSIVQIVLPAGKHHVKLRYLLTGTTETALTNGKILKAGATLISNLPTISGSGWNEVEFEMTSNGTLSTAFQATALGTTGAVYSAVLIATLMSTG